MYGYLLCINTLIYFMYGILQYIMQLQYSNTCYFLMDEEKALCLRIPLQFIYLILILVISILMYYPLI